MCLFLCSLQLWEVRYKVWFICFLLTFCKNIFETTKKCKSRFKRGRHSCGYYDGVGGGVTVTSVIIHFIGLNTVTVNQCIAVSV